MVLYLKIIINFHRFTLLKINISVSKFKFAIETSNFKLRHHLYKSGAAFITPSDNFEFIKSRPLSPAASPFRIQVIVDQFLAELTFNRLIAEIRKRMCLLWRESVHIFSIKLGRFTWHWKPDSIYTTIVLCKLEKFVVIFSGGK